MFLLKKDVFLHSQICSLKVALVVELVDARDLKSREHCVRAGSSPARGTTYDINAEVAQLVEHNLAKVRVASSSLVFRSLILKKWALKAHFLFSFIQ